MVDAVVSVVLVAAWGLHVLTLPANWIMLGIFGLWAWGRDVAVGPGLWALLGALAVAGEVAEWVLQDRTARRFGASSTGSWLAVVGALVGAVLGAPLALGVGAVLGACLGAYGGCLLGELLRGASWAQARQAAWGALRGRFGGMLAKMALGAAMVGLMVAHMWA